MQVVLAYDADEAGQRAEEQNAREVLALLESWGKVRITGEPMAQAVARLEGDLSRLALLLSVYEAIDHPAARDRVADLEHDWEQSSMYWSELFHDLRPTEHSRARTAEEYQAMMTVTPIQAARGQRIDFAALKDRIDIVDFIGRSTPLRPTAGKFMGRCPLPGHDDSTASLWVYPSSKSWYCFGCNQGGDVITFAQKLDGTTARDLAGVA